MFLESQEAKSKAKILLFEALRTLGYHHHRWRRVAGVTRGFGDDTHATGVINSVIMILQLNIFSCAVTDFKVTMSFDE